LEEDIAVPDMDHPLYPAAADSIQTDNKEKQKFSPKARFWHFYPLNLVFTLQLTVIST